MFSRKHASDRNQLVILTDRVEELYEALKRRQRHDIDGLSLIFFQPEWLAPGSESTGHA
jgi:hypothetical protein